MTIDVADSGEKLAEKPVLLPTPTEDALPRRLADFATLGEALDLYSSFYHTPANAQQLLDTLGLAEKRTTRFAKLSGGTEPVTR